MTRQGKKSFSSRRKNSRYVAKRSQLLAYEALERRQMLTASLGFNTIGASFSDADITSALPNPEGDVSPDYYVEIGEQTFTVFSRDNSEVVLTKSLNQFFSDAGADLVGEDLQNPRIVFDRGTQRWFAAATGDGEGPLAGNWVHLAFSDTADPSGQWKQVQFVPDITGLRLHTDISMGVDADGVYLSTRNLINGVLQDVSIYSIPKAELFLPNPTITNISKFDNLATSVYGGQIQFASNFEASDGTMFAFSNRNAGNLNSIQITGANTANAMLSMPETILLDVANNPDPRIFFDPMSPPVMAAPRTIDQPVFDEAGMLVTSERLTMPAAGLTSSLIESNGTIFGARTVSIAFNPTADFRVNGINWFALDVVAGQTPVLNESPLRGPVSHVILDTDFLGNPGDDDGDLVPEYGRVTYFNPSVAINETGLVTVVFNGATTFDAANLGNVTAEDFGNVDPATGLPLNPSAVRSSVYASVGLTVNGAQTGMDMEGNPIFGRRSIQLEDPQLITYSLASEAFNQASAINLWGQYSSLRPDPTNPNSFFAAIPFAGVTSDEWSVQLAEVLPTELRPVVEATGAADMIIIRRNADDFQFIEVEINGVVTDRFDESILDQIIVFGHGGPDQILIDHVNGDPTPVSGFVLFGGRGTDTIETNTAEDVQYLIDSLGAQVEIFYPAYLAQQLAASDMVGFPIDDMLGVADGFLTPLTVNGLPIPENMLVSSQLLDIENVVSGSGDDTFIFEVGPLAGNAEGRDGDDRFVFLGPATVDGSINGGTGFNTLDVQQRNAATQIQLFSTGMNAGFNGRTLTGPVGQFNEILDQFRDISLVRGSISNTSDSIQALNQFEANFTIVIPDIDPDDVANPDSANSFVASTLVQDGVTLFLTEFDIFIGSVLDDQFNVQSNNLDQITLVGRTGDDEFNFSSDAPVNGGVVGNIGGIVFVEGGAGANSIVVSDESRLGQQDFLVLSARISGPVEIVYSAADSGTFEVTIIGSEPAVDRFILQSFLSINELTVFGNGGDDLFIIQDLSQAEVSLFGGDGDDQYVIEQVNGVDNRNVLISDSIDAERDRAIIAGTLLDELFIVDLDSFESDQFTFIGIEEFAFDGRGGDDEFYVRAISADFPILLLGGEGNDVFYVSSDAPVNAGTLATLNNDLTIDGEAGINRIIISNEVGAALDVAIRTETITGLFNGLLTYRSTGGVFGLVDENGDLDDENFGGIDITGSNGGDDSFLIASFLAENSLVINGRLGADEFQIGDESGDNVEGVVILDGASDGDTYSLFLANIESQDVVIEDSGFSGIDTIEAIGSMNNDQIELTESGIVSIDVQARFDDSIEAILISGRGGSDTILLDNAMASVVTLAGNFGNDQLIVNGTVGIADLTLLGGMGNDQLMINDTSQSTMVSAAGGDGNDVFAVSSAARGDVSLSGEQGADEYLVEFVGSGTRMVDIMDGGADAGQDQATLFGNASENVFQISSSLVQLQQETVSYGNMLEIFSVVGEGGGDEFNLTSAAMDITLDGGAGNDRFNLSSDAPFPTGDTSGILGDVNILGGAGQNQLNLINAGGSPGNITVTAAFIFGIIGGDIQYSSEGGRFARTDGAIGGIYIAGSNAGADVFDVQNLRADDTLRIEGLGGDDQFMIRSGLAGDAWFDGGEGSDNYVYQFGLASSREVVINDTGTSGTDTLQVLGTSGDDQIAISADEISDALSSLIYNIPLSEIEIDGQAGNDTFTVNGVSGGRVRLFGNQGNDRFVVNSTDGVMDVDLFGGAGNDIFEFNGSSATTRIDADGSTGDDTFDVGAGATGNLFLDGEAGSDLYTVQFAGFGERRIDTRDSGADGEDVTEALGTAADDRIAVRTTRFLYDDELVIFDENTERVMLDSGAGADRLVVFGSRSPLTELFAGSGDDNFVVNGGSAAEVINLSGEAGDDRFLVRKTTVDTVNNLFGGDGNDRFNVGSTGNQNDGNLGLIRGVLNLFGGAHDVNGEDQLLANDNGVNAAYSYSITPTSITPIPGPAGLDRTNFAGINYDASMEFVRLDGTPQANLFQVTASQTTRYFIDGNSPSSGVGDQLVVTPDLNDGRMMTVTDPAAGAGFVTFADGKQIIQFEDIETVLLDGSSNLVLPAGFDPTDFGPVAGDPRSLTAPDAWRWSEPGESHRDEFFSSVELDDWSAIEDEVLDEWLNW